MKVKMSGDSDTEVSLHESGDEVSDAETPSPTSLSFSLTTTSETVRTTETTPSTSSPAVPVTSTTVAASPTWSTESASLAGSRTSLPPWQTTTGLEFGRPSSAIVHVSSTPTPTSAMLETLTKFMKDEFSKLHARIDRAVSQRLPARPPSSGVSRFDIQWMERIDEKLRELQTMAQINAERVILMGIELNKLKLLVTPQESNPANDLTAKLQQLTEQVQLSQQMIAEIKLPTPEVFMQRLQAVTENSSPHTTAATCQSTQTSASTSTPVQVEYDVGATPINKAVIPLLAQQSSACGPNPGLKIRDGAYQRPSPDNARFPPSSLLVRRMARQELSVKEVATLRASGAIPKDAKTKIQMVTFANSLPYSQTTPAPKYEVPLQPKDAYSQFLSGLNSAPPSSPMAVGTESSQQVVIHNGLHFMDFSTFRKAIEKICITVKPRVCSNELRESWTQTVTTQAQSLFLSNACQNCRQRDHKIAECRLPWRPDMCHVCYQDQVTTATCFRPHDKQYKDYFRGRCQGCGIPSQLFDPHCNSCNRRYPGYKDWIAAKYTPEEVEQFHKGHLRSLKRFD